VKKVIAAIGIIILSIVATLVFVITNDEFDKELTQIAKDTYQFFEEFTDENTGLTVDRVDVETEVELSRHTSPTNIAMYLASVVSAKEFGFISKGEAKQKIEVTLNTLEEMETWNGLYYNWYHTGDASLMTDWGQFISTVDNGWLTASLVVVGQYFPEFSPITEPLVQKMDYSNLYDPAVGQFRGGFDVSENKLTDHHYGIL